MALILLGFLISIVCGASAAVFLGHVPKLFGRPPFSRSAMILFGVILTLFLLMPVTRVFISGTTTTFISMNPREGEKYLEFLGLPPESTNDFCYRFSMVGITILADFEMSEDDFHAWMKSQKWSTIEFRLEGEETFFEIPESDTSFVEAIVYPVRQFESQNPLMLKRGYFFFTSKPGDPDNTTTIFYDLESGRAYVQVTTY